MLDKSHLLGLISLYVNLETAPGFASAAYIISIPLHFYEDLFAPGRAVSPSSW